MLSLKYTIPRALVVAASLFISSYAAGGGSMAHPDLTSGDKIPEGATHDWTLGATGARGWIYSDRLETSDARQIAITKVDQGSPADGKLRVGDVIVGIDGKPFSYDARVEFGKALTVAESDQGKGSLALVRWRDGKQENVVVKLPVLGNYSATAPYDCPKSKQILERGCAALAMRMEDSGYERTQNPISRSLNALALLASGNPAYLPLVKKEAEWASGYSASSMATWYYGYVIMFLSEYHIATDDDSVMDGLKRLVLEASNGQSMVGSWGHGFAGDDRRLGGYGMMNAPGVTLTIALVLAREAGVEAAELDLAIKRSLDLLRFYIGKGSIPYGDHAPWIENHDDNGKNGMAAVLFSLLGENEGAEYFSRMSLACHGNERDTGHTGNFWNITWAIPGVVQAGPDATGAWMSEFGAWYFDLARRWDGNFPHQGPPQPNSDSTGNWDATGAYLLAYAMPLKVTMLTGNRDSRIPRISATEANLIINDGRGWTNKHREEFYDSLSVDELFERLASWSPVVRERAAMALARRKVDPPPVAELVKMLESDDLDARYGACTAFSMLGNAAAPAVPVLQACLQDEDLWLRIKAAEALAKIGEPAMYVLPDLLKMIARQTSPSDPRAMEQRYITSAVFGEMLRGSSLESVDKDLLRKAVAAGLGNQDGRARGTIGLIYEKLSFEEIKPLIPAIQEAIETPAPSGIMFANQIRVTGLRVLSKHHVESGIPLCADYLLKQNPWASEHRTPEILEILLNYGANAQSAIPALERAALFFEAGEVDFPMHLSQQKAAAVREAIRKIKASDFRPELKRIDQ